MVSSEEVAATLISRQPSGERSQLGAALAPLLSVYATVEEAIPSHLKLGMSRVPKQANEWQ